MTTSTHRPNLIFFIPDELRASSVGCYGDPVSLTNDFAGTRVFGTTWGHGNVTWHDPVFLTMIARGVRWAAGRDN